MAWWKKSKRSEEPQRRRLNASERANQIQDEKRGQQLFRRNRTLVGSLSPLVGSASELSGDLRSPRAHVHHLTAHRRMLTSLLFVVTAGIMLFGLLVYEFTAKVEVAPTAGVAIDQKRYQQVLDDYFAFHPFERLRFLLNETDLTAFLSRTVPEVERVRANGSAGFGASQFVMTFREPVVGWQIRDTNYYVDDKGIPFQVNYYDSPAVKIVDNSGVPQTTGTAVASGRFLRFVGRAVIQAKANGLTVSQAIIPANTTHEIEIMLEGRKFPIKLSLDRPVGEQVEDMQRAVSYFDTHSITPTYIDVRVSGKAYYK